MSPSNMIDAVTEVMERSGLFYSAQPIDDKFMQILLKVDGKKAGSPEFDPSLHELGQENSFWVGCWNRTGELIATLATRRLEADTFMEACRSYRLWYGEKIRFTEPLDIVIDRYDRIPCGTAAFSGAGWVRQDWRGRGLSWAMTRIGYLLAMKQWQPDWMIGMAVAGIANSMIPNVDYGFPRSDPFATGYIIPGFPLHTLNLLTMTRQEAYDLAARDHGFLQSRPKLMIDPEFGEQLRAQRRRLRSEQTTSPAISAVG